MTRPPGRLREERGFTMLATIGVMLLLLLLVAATAASTIASSNGAGRSTKATQALQGADAAANLALQRLSELKVDQDSVGNVCVNLSAQANATFTTASLGAGSSWCPSVAVPIPNTDSAKYWVGAPTTSVNSSVSGTTTTVTTTFTRNIVGQATVGSVTRRVQIKAKMLKTAVTTTGITSTPLFQGFALLSMSPITLTNGYYVSGAGIRSDKGITLNTTSPPTTNNCHVVNGPITPGQGYTVQTQNNATTSCNNSLTPATTALSMSPVSIPATNDDSSKAPTVTGSASWSSSGKNLNVQNSGDTATLKGNVYVFCNLTMSGGTLNISPTDGKAVQIYIPAPNTNGCSSTSLNIYNQAVVNNSTQSTLGASGLQIYASGNSTLTFNNNSTIYAAVWAPLGTVWIENQGGITGAVAAYDAEWGGNNPYIIWDSKVNDISGGTGVGLPTTTTTFGSYSQDSGGYTECPSSAGTDSSPGSGC